MNETESKQPEDQSTPTEEALNLIERIKPTADAEVGATDELAIKGEQDLTAAGFEWFKGQLSKISYLEITRIILLAALFALVILWLLSVGGLMILLGFGIWGFAVSNSVAIAYMTTTTVSVLGLFKIAATWLFSDVGVKPKGE
jgi:hypothetical protein